ncbi:MAG TPA: acyltransferase family protein, partial [Ferruginibacter sp.]|jgi:peptidoglycan/LPS O-acetylase OafA/YrhL|nr:acyltransferase family protein [Ferruginibacter sp.]
MNIEFLLGVFIALIVEKIPKILTWPILLVGTALFLTGAYIYNHEPHNSIGNMSHLFNRVTLFGFSSFLIVLALVKMELNKSMRVNNILLYLGDASYSIYLIHLPLVVAFYKILSRSGVQNEYLLFILNLLLFAVVCFAGIIIYLKIEKPLIRKLNQRLLRK